MCAPRSVPTSTEPPAAHGPVIDALELSAGPGAKWPNVVASDDAVWVSWVEPMDGAAEDGDEDTPVPHRLLVARGSLEGLALPATVHEGDDLVASYADFPALGISRNGTLFASWAKQIPEGGHAYTVEVARSIDEGETWTELGTVHQDGTATEHGFVSFVPAEDEAEVRIVWLDGRQTVDHGPMTMRTARVGEAVTDDELLDDRVCDCCGTGAALASSGPLIVYRDRLAGEIRDTSVTRKTSSGWETNTQLADGWKLAGCPVNGPQVDARGSNVAVAWFTAAGDVGRVRAAFSSDGGATFGKAIDVETQIERTVVVGRVDVVLDDNGTALVTFITHEKSRGSQIFLRRVHPNGTLGRPVLIANTAQGRNGGFPRTAWLQGHLVVVWTDHAGHGIHAATLVPPP